MTGRFERIADAIPSGLDGVLLTSEANMLYATGIELESGYVVVTPKDAVMLCDFRYTESAQQAGVPAVRPLEKDALSKLISELNIKTLGYEDKKISVYAFNAVKEQLDGIELVPLGDTVDRVRSYKDPEELSRIITAQKIADRAFEFTLKNISFGMSEKELACLLDSNMMRYGADAPAFTTLVLSGAKTSMPHGVPTKEGCLSRGFLTFDFGVKLDGYRCDMTRTIVIGRADEEMRHMYDTVLKAQLKATAAIRHTSTGYEVDKIARDVIETEYPNSFGHALGHGVGLDIHEFPRVSPAAKDERIGMWSVVTIEPGIYIPGKYGCRIEDTVIIGDEGAIVLTDVSKELLEIY